MEAARAHGKHAFPPLRKRSLGLTLYVFGNRRASAPRKPRDPSAPAPENHWLILSPTSAVAGWRF